jgi:hypothetical protein
MSMLPYDCFSCDVCGFSGKHKDGDNHKCDLKEKLIWKVKKMNGDVTW